MWDKISIQDFTEKLVGLKHGPYLWSGSFDIALFGKILYQAFTWNSSDYMRFVRTSKTNTD